MYVNKTKRHLLLSVGASREIREILVDLLALNISLDFLIAFKLVSGINVSCGLLYKL